MLCLFVCAGIGYAQDTGADRTSSDTVTISRSEFDELKDSVAALQDEVNKLKGNASASQTQGKPAATDTAGAEGADQTAASPETPAAPAPVEPAPAQTGGGKALALPDISLVVQAKGHLSSDKRDDARNRLRLSEAEIGIQGYVYPNVKADAFLTTSPEEGAPMSVEEAYLTYIGLGKGLNVSLGKKHVPFGRTNLLHNHSWLYVNQPLVLRNLVAEESLAGEGANISYLLPTKSNLFAQLDLGTWTGEGPGESTNLPDIVVGPGASFADRFNTARLWTSYPINDYNEVELGGSYAQGASDGLAITGRGQARLTGMDVSYRHFGQANRRLLLRAENVWRREHTDGLSSTAAGYYLFGNYRWDKNNSLGLLYDWTEFPQSPQLHQSAISLILTKQFSEQYYIRLQGTHGSRPDDPSYNELWLQWVWGVGPHTHNLE